MAFADRRRDGADFCLRYFVGVGHLLSFFFVRLSFLVCLFVCFGQKEYVILGDFFCLLLLAIWGSWLLQITSPGYMKPKRKPRDSPLCHSLDRKACLFLFTFQSLLIFSEHCLGFLAAFSKRNKEKSICSVLIQNWLIFALFFMFSNTRSWSVLKLGKD